MHDVDGRSSRTMTSTPRGRRLRATVAAVSMTALLAACGPGVTNSPAPGAENSGESVFTREVSGELKVSGFNPSDEVGTSRADYAEQQLSGVTLSLDTTSFDPQKFAAQGAAGQVPDLIQTDRSTIATLADQELIMPLDQCYSTFEVTPNEQYYPATIADVTYAGAVYGVPQFFQPSALLVNTRVTEAAGVSAADFDTSQPDRIVELARQLSKQNGGKPSVVGFDGDLPGSAALWFTVFGGRTSAEDGRPALDDPANVRALTWMKELMDAQGGYPAVKSFKDTMDVFGAENQFVKDQVAAQTWAQWYPNVLADYADRVEIEAVPIKTLDGTPIALAGGTSFAIPTGSRNPAAACAYAIAVTSTDAWLAAGKARSDTKAEENSINTGLFTASPIADQQVREQFVKPSGDEQFDQVISTYYRILGENRGLGSSAVGQQITNDLGNAVIVTLNGEKDPTTALADAQASSLRAWDQSNAGRR